MMQQPQMYRPPVQNQHAPAHQNGWVDLGPAQQYQGQRPQAPPIINGVHGGYPNQIHVPQQPQQLYPQHLASLYKNKQISDLLAYYQNSLCLQKTADAEDYQIPLTISVSKSPLFIRVRIDKNFPMVPPQIHILAKVTHPEIDNHTKLYIGPAVSQWNQQSSLLNCVKQVHINFEQRPPIPEDPNNIIVNPQPGINPGQVQNGQMAPPIAAPVQVPQIEKVEERINLANIQSEVDQQIKNQLHPPKASEIFAKLQSGAVSLEEVKILLENEQYLKDYLLDAPQLQCFLSECASISDQTQSIALQNTKYFEKVSKSMEKHNSVNETYTASKESLQKALQELEQFKQQTQPREMAASLMKTCNEAQKESDSIRKQFKNKDIAVEKFIDDYKKARQRYYELEMAKHKVASMTQQQQQ